MKIIIATIRKWHIKNAQIFKEQNPQHDIKLIFKKEDFDEEEIREFCPEYIMFPHWSWIIPESIFSNYKCIVYHISDVPNARGGSPLQNQIADGIHETKISAIAVDKGLDTGNVYIKRDLCLNGSAEEIFIRSSDIIFRDMIPYIIDHNPMPVPQEGKGYLYKRRIESQSEIPQNGDLHTLFEHIRMLDADDYPRAYINWGNYSLSFSRAKLCVDKIVADVEIKIKGD